MSWTTVPISEVLTLLPRYETSSSLSLPSTQMHLSTKDSSLSSSSSHPSTVKPWAVGSAVGGRGKGGGKERKSYKQRREWTRERERGGKGGGQRARWARWRGGWVAAGSLDTYSCMLVLEVICRVKARGCMPGAEGRGEGGGGSGERTTLLLGRACWRRDDAARRGA